MYFSRIKNQNWRINNQNWYVATANKVAFVGRAREASSTSSKLQLQSLGIIFNLSSMQDASRARSGKSQYVREYDGVRQANP